MTLVTTIKTKGTVTDEARRDFAIKTREARYFYNEDIAKFLEEMQQQAVDLQICHTMIDATGTPEATRQQAINRLAKGEKWFLNLDKEISAKFLPFLRIQR